MPVFPGPVYVPVLEHVLGHVHVPGLECVIGPVHANVLVNVLMLLVAIQLIQRCRWMMSGDAGSRWGRTAANSETFLRPVYTFH